MDSDSVPETFKSKDLVHVEPVTFDLHVKLHGKQEVLRGLSLAPGSPYHPERYSKELGGLVRLKVLDNDGPLVHRIPVETEVQLLQGGLDGLDGITPEDFIGRDEGPGYRTALSALKENDELDLIVVPDLMACAEHSSGFPTKREIEVVQQAIIDQCEDRRDRFAILDVPRKFDIEKAIQWRLNFDSAFGAFYYPWVAISTRSGHRLIPPSGFVAGVIARCDQAQGPHKAPANETLNGVAYLERRLEDEDVGYLNAHAVNPIRALPTRGIRIWGARTVASRKEWRFIPVRRVFNAVSRAVYKGTMWAVFEPNSHDLWQKVETNLKFFLGDLFQQGYFSGERMEQGFFVQCNEETNPPERVDAGELRALIGLAPARPAEFITFVLEQQLPEVPPD